MKVAVIDFGKTNVKVALVDTAAAREVDVRKVENVVCPRPPYPHYDTEAHWSFLIQALGELASRHRIEAISVAAHGATAALVDASGDLALPILDYEHEGPDSLGAAYDAVRPPFDETGSPRLAAGLNLGAQLFWQFRTFEAARRVARILMYPQYWAFRLCGVAASEATSLGCHTDLWSSRASGFSSLADRMGWTPMFPPLRRAADRLGTLRPEIAQATGLNPATPVLCGIHDSNASLYPHLLTRHGPFSVVSTGTWVVCMAVRGAAVMLDAGRDTLVNVDATGRPVPSARFMGGREYDVVRAGADLSGSDADRRGVLAAPVMLLPAVEPGSGPFRGRTSTWTGSPATAGERGIALAWYLALMTGTCLAMIGAGGPVVVEGPLARNGDYLEMLRACTGRAVTAASDSATGTSIGAALLADAEAAPKKETPLQGPAPDPDLVAYAAGWRRAVGEA